MGKETLLKRVKLFWAELQQLKWPKCCLQRWGEGGAVVGRWRGLLGYEFGEGR